MGGAGIAGIVLTIVYFFRKPANGFFDPEQRFLLLCLACVAAPVFSVIVLKSVVYDDWRHLYFIYPPFVILLLFAVRWVHRQGVLLKRLMQVLCGVQLLMMITFLIRNHPYGNVYFNEVTPRQPEYLRHHYDLDYWGTSVKQAYEYILEHDKRYDITVAGYLAPVARNLNILTTHQREKIKLTDPSAPHDYFITNFRNHPQEYEGAVFHEIRVQNSAILKVYKRQPTP